MARLFTAVTAMLGLNKTPHRYFEFSNSIIFACSLALFASGCGQAENLGQPAGQGFDVYINLPSENLGQQSPEGGPGQTNPSMPGASDATGSSIDTGYVNPNFVPNTEEEVETPSPELAADDDNDGLSNEYEGNLDTDQDGLPNSQDTDSDNDGIPDSVESGGTEPAVDSDGDGDPDFVDSDSDNDGLLDLDETLGADGIPASGDETSTTNPDSDGDGFNDLVETAFGSDPNDQNSLVPPDVFFVVLPWKAPMGESRDLEFSSTISNADILIQVDLSGSMQDEHTNLAEGINTVIIEGVKEVVPNVGFGLVKFGTISDQTYKVAQNITTDASKVQTAVNGISTCDGSKEAHIETLYLSASGDAFEAEICDDFLFFGCFSKEKISIPAANCGPGTVGGACFRDFALPIFIMISDESFIELDFDSGPSYTLNHAIDAMNEIGAKFIGVDSSSLGIAETDYSMIAQGTGSVDADGNPFNFDIATDGTGLSNSIVDAVVDLTNGIQLENVTTQVAGVENEKSVDSAQFIKAITPISANPPDGVAGKDESSFTTVKPGTDLLFRVDFYNDIYEPPDSKATLFEAQINVLGDGALLDTRQVIIVVPGLRVFYPTP